MSWPETDCKDGEDEAKGGKGQERSGQEHQERERSVQGYQERGEMRTREGRAQAKGSSALLQHTATVSAVHTTVAKASNKNTYFVSLTIAAVPSAAPCPPPSPSHGFGAAAGCVCRLLWLY